MESLLSSPLFAPEKRREDNDLNQAFCLHRRSPGDCSLRSSLGSGFPRTLRSLPTRLGLIAEDIELRWSAGSTTRSSFDRLATTSGSTATACAASAIPAPAVDVAVILGEADGVDFVDLFRDSLPQLSSLSSSFRELSLRSMDMFAICSGLTSEALTCRDLRLNMFHSELLLLFWRFLLGSVLSSEGRPPASTFVISSTTCTTSGGSDSNSSGSDHSSDLLRRLHRKFRSIEEELRFLLAAGSRSDEAGLGVEVSIGEKAICTLDLLPLRSGSRTELMM